MWSRPDAVVRGQLSPSAKFALAQIEPFDVNCLGAKIPDSNTMPSLANSDCDIVTLQSPGNATHLAGIAFRPSYTWATVTAASGLNLNWGIDWSTYASNRSKRASIIANFELLRTTSHAVRISCPLAPTTVTGFVHIALLNESTYGETTWTWPTTIAGISGAQFYRRLPLANLTQTPITVVNKWLDDTAFRYSSSSADIGDLPGGTVSAAGSTFQTDFSWATIVVILEGAPINVGALSFEHLLLTEGIPKYDAAIVGTQAAPNQPDVLSAVSSMQTESEPFFNAQDQESYYQRSLAALQQGAAAAGEVAFNNVAVPLMQRFAYAGTGAGLSMAMAAAGIGGIAGVNSNPNRLVL